MSKDPITVTIQSMPHNQLNAMLQKMRPTIHGVNTMDGFSFVKNNFSRDRLLDIDVEYEVVTGLSDLEIQAEQKNYAYEHDINLVAFHEEKFVGILAMEWGRSEYGQDSFWCYRDRFVDVQNAYQGRRVGKQLIQYLENMPEVQNKILQFGMYRDEKAAVAFHVQNTFTNKNYMVLPKFSEPTDQLPKNLGCYITDSVVSKERETIKELKRKNLL